MATEPVTPTRRGFLGGLAGAFVGGVFRRLAPPPPPLAPAAVRGLTLADYTAAMKRAYTPEAVAGVEYRVSPLLALIEARALQQTIEARARRQMDPRGLVVRCGNYRERTTAGGQKPTKG